MCVYIYIYIHIYIYIDVSLSFSLSLSLYIYIYTSLSLYIYIYIYIYLALSLSLFIYIYIYIYIVSVRKGSPASPPPDSGLFYINSICCPISINRGLSISIILLGARLRPLSTILYTLYSGPEHLFLLNLLIAVYGWQTSVLHLTDHTMKNSDLTGI